MSESNVVAEQSKEGELQIVEPSALEALNRAEIDLLIATAKKYPRSITQFQRDALDLATMDAAVAAECTYRLPRAGKEITGPSVRFAEIIAYSWGNCRAGARMVGQEKSFVTAQGFFADLQRNVAYTFEVARRITDSKGKRYNDDMIGVTGNAASSIAMRNAVFHGIPKAIWLPIWQRSMAAAKGDAATLEQRRAEALRVLQEEFKIDVHRACRALEVEGPKDIGLDMLLKLSQMIAAVRGGDAQLEAVFPPVSVVKTPPPQPEQKSAKDLAAEQAKRT